VVIEKVAKNFEGERADLREGDILLRWRCGQVHGEIQSPFDLAKVEIEQAPRGTVTLEGLRTNEDKVWRLGQNAWRVEVQPNFTEAELALYREGQELAAAGKLSPAAEKWKAIAGHGSGSTQQWLRTWLLFHLAQGEAARRDWAESDRAYQEALQITASEPGPSAQIQRAWGKTFVQRNDWQHADEHFRPAVTLEQTAETESLALAIGLDDLGALARKQGDLAKAESFYSQALRLRQNLAPDSLALAASLNNLGELAEHRGILEAAESLDQQALELAQKIAPGSLTEAEALGNLGDVAYDRGKLPTAKDFYRRSFEIRNQLEPDSLDVAKSLNGLGLVAWKQGNLAEAEEYHRPGVEGSREAGARQPGGSPKPDQPWQCGARTR
jgi:tetratricopeptide (TPR) repeat protein